LTTFYLKEISSSAIFLDEINSRHAIKSLRLKIGDHINIVNGKGSVFQCKIVNPHPKKTELLIEGKEAYNEDIPLILAFAPTKNNDRNEWVIEKGVEIGMTECYPIFSQNSERRKWNSERMEKIAISAMKQSGRYWLTKIHDPINFQDFIAIDHPENKLIAHCRSSTKKPLHNLTKSSKPQLIVIGPEGDFTEKEIQLAEKNEFTSIHLGENRLRTETACISSLSVLKLG
jgi:16S rRNA (uracil1498-N3)-methyltransferase